MGSLQERLGAAVAHVPKSGKEAQEAANSLYEGLERLKDAVLKQSGDLVSLYEMSESRASVAGLIELVRIGRYQPICPVHMQRRPFHNHLLLACFV
jgi:hypothetical protein